MASSQCMRVAIADPENNQLDWRGNNDDEPGLSGSRISHITKWQTRRIIFLALLPRSRPPPPVECARWTRARSSSWFHNGRASLPSPSINSSIGNFNWQLNTNGSRSRWVGSLEVWHLGQSLKHGARPTPAVGGGHRLASWPHKSPESQRRADCSDVKSLCVGAWQ